MYPQVDSIETYGGALTNATPVEDPTTDLSADGWNPVAGGVAAMSHLCPRAWCVFIGDATTPTIANVDHEAAWGSASGVKPTIAHVGTGHYRITWPATVTNELAATYTVNLRRAVANARGATAFQCQCDPQGANVIDVYTFNAAGTANNAVGTYFDVVAI